MIYLFSDFGYQGPYVGELRAVLVRNTNSDHSVIDLMHDAPAFDPGSSAYLLAALSKRFQPGDACLAIVDPGVGRTGRMPIIVEADGVFYCGPDNGLFSQIIHKAKTVTVNEITWRPENSSNSFHGRDIFAPALLKHINKEELAVRPVERGENVGHDWPAERDNVIYIDGFGNLITGLTKATLAPHSNILFSAQEIEYAETFSSTKQGEPFWYFNSMGLVEIAVNQQRADEYFGAKIGASLSVVA